MVKDKPKWWKILLKEPGNWLIWLTLGATIGSFLIGELVDSHKNKESINQSVVENSNKK